MQVMQFRYLLFILAFMFDLKQEELAADAMAYSDIWNLWGTKSIWDLITVVNTMRHHLKMTKEPEGISNKVMSCTNGLY